jgi:hypothetical protein
MQARHSTMPKIFSPSLLTKGAQVDSPHIWREPWECREDSTKRIVVHTLLLQDIGLGHRCCGKNIMQVSRWRLEPSDPETTSFTGLINTCVRSTVGCDLPRSNGAPQAMSTSTSGFAAEKAQMLTLLSCSSQAILLSNSKGP